MKTITGPCLCGKPERVEDHSGEQVMIRCPLYIKLRGQNPQGGDIDEWGCAISWIPILLIENAQKINELGAAIENFRNEMVRQNDQIIDEHKAQLDNGELFIDRLIGR